MGAEGLYKGKNSQHLYMVSAKAPPPEELTTQTIGMLNLLGRRKNQKFLQNVLKQSVRVRGVPKPRDLLPMLSFGVADLLVVSQHTLTYLQKASEQELFVKKLDLNFRINLAAFQESTDTAVRNNVAGCLEQINTLSFSSQLFSVDTWQTL